MAKRLCDFEKENMRDVVKFIKDEGHAGAVDLVETSAVDFFMDKTAWEDAKESLELMEKAGGNMDGIQKLEKEDADKVSNVNGTSDSPEAQSLVSNLFLAALPCRTPFWSRLLPSLQPLASQVGSSNTGSSRLPGPSTFHAHTGPQGFCQQDR